MTGINRFVQVLPLQRTVATTTAFLAGGTSLLIADKVLQNASPMYDGAREQVWATAGVALQHSAARVGSAVAHHPIAFAAVYGLLLGSVVWWNKFGGRESLLRASKAVSQSAGEFAARQAPKNLGMGIMAAGLAKTSLEMLQHMSPAFPEGYLNAYGDALFATAFIAGIAGFERLSDWGKVIRMPLVARASSLAALLATAVCVVDDAIHPMLYLLRSGLFPK